MALQQYANVPADSFTGVAGTKLLLREQKIFQPRNGHCSVAPGGVPERRQSDLVSREALMSIATADEKIHGPQTFMPRIKVRQERMSALTLAILNMVCVNIHEIQPTYPTQVNVTARTLMEEGFRTSFEMTLRNTDVSPESIILELLERPQWKLNKKLIAAIRGFQSIGIGGVYVDDYDHKSKWHREAVEKGLALGLFNGVKTPDNQLGRFGLAESIHFLSRNGCPVVVVEGQEHALHACAINHATQGIDPETHVRVQGYGLDRPRLILASLQ